MEDFLIYLQLSSDFLNELDFLLLERSYITARTRSKLTKKALSHYSKSPFAKLYSDESDQDFMAVLSSTRTAFSELLVVFRSFYCRKVVWKPGSILAPKQKTKGPS
jgi:hypothetical protein